MDRLSKSRVVAIFLVVFLVMGIFSFRLFKLQVSEKAQSAAMNGRTIRYYTPVQAARGQILDRNGKLLVSNRASYNLAIANLAFFSGENANEQVKTLLELCDEMNQPVVDTLPITMEKPYMMREDASYTAKSHLNAYLKWRGWDPEMSAKNLLTRMKKRYNIPEQWDDDLARRVIGVRYELDLRYCVGLSNYVLAEDVSTQMLAAAMELGLPGVLAEPSTIRTYNTKYAAHILGRTGPIYAEETEYYKSLGYSLDTLVGKEGLEQAFEQYLHGTNGQKAYLISASDGSLLESYYTKLPQPGNNVSLTIDIDLQAVAEDMLEATILDLQKNGTGLRKEGKDAVGGAVVAVDVKTGEVLTSASYPSFDITAFNRDYNLLLEDKTNPLKNRALTETYNPGSIYKMVTAIAAVDENGAGRWRQIRWIFRSRKDRSAL